MYGVLNAYLKNGMKVMLHYIPGVQTMACGLWVRQGSSFETDQTNGLSHFAEHLLLNPDNVDNPIYKSLIEKVASEGVIYNAATTKEYTCFHFTGLSRTLQLCLSCLAEIAKNNRAYILDNFQKEKSVVLQEATTFYSSFQQIKERTSQAIWGDSGTGKIIMGNMNHISNATPENIEQLVNAAYVPENASLIVIGNINYEETLKMIEEKFSDWKDIFASSEERPVEKEPGIYINSGYGVSTVFSIGFRTPEYGAEERPCIDMMTRILGNSGMQSRIVQELRVKRGLSYNLGGFSSFYKSRGTLGFMAVCDKNRSLEAAKVMIDILHEAKEVGFTEEEIEREKRIMETSMLLAVDNITEHLRYIGKCASMDRIFYIENEIREIQKITSCEVKKAAESILREENMGLAVIGDCETEKMLEIVTI